MKEKETTGNCTADKTLEVKLQKPKDPDKELLEDLAMEQREGPGGY
ncbi:hypothetical protein IKF43_01125 [Candidatus Saccharibacteria bacterium]|nr:hypothetical protein [Candidatus Saccharibacteria bacterium]